VSLLRASNEPFRASDGRTVLTEAEYSKGARALLLSASAFGRKYGGTLKKRSAFRSLPRAVSMLATDHLGGSRGFFHFYNPDLSKRTLAARGHFEVRDAEHLGVASIRKFAVICSMQFLCLVYRAAYTWYIHLVSFNGRRLH